MMKKTILAVIIACMMLAMTACAAQKAEESLAGSEPAAPSEQTENVSTPEDGQNPVMNFVGVYHADRVNMLVEAQGAENAKITVTWAGSAWEQTQWVMSGRFDTDTLTLAYSDGTLTELSYQSSGEVDTATVTYDDGTGRILFHAEDNTLTWEDDKTHVADGLVFSFGAAPDALETGDPDYYSPVTAMDKRAVEELCFSIRDAYLSENWYALADLIRYPITVNGTELRDADAFLEYMKDKTVHESDRAVMLDESCHDMFVNGEGICMGSGQVWLNDPNYMTDELPTLAITALSGIE